jgi:hypothetical protein
MIVFGMNTSISCNLSPSTNLSVVRLQSQEYNYFYQKFHGNRTAREFSFSEVQTMKIRILTLLLLPLALLSSRAYSADLGMVRMGIVQGDVQIYSEDARDWVPAATNTPLGQGNRIWVPAGGRSELQVLGGIVLRLDEFTSLDILSLGDNAYQFFVNSGRIYVNNRAGRVEQLQIDTPVSSVACNEASTVMIDVEENGTTEISVLEGYAYAETRNGRIRVTSGRTLRIGENLQAELYPLKSSDEWLEWNRDLDRRFSETGDSYRYLPEELNDYGYDLDNNGTWFQDASYGYVWTPSIAVSINWAPYHYGRWVWIGGNYVWISYERWGWAPYHYGRWVFLRHAGWCWVPPRQGAVHWGPGYVGWIHTAKYVSWIPLAPGETYYGHGYYGPGSVNIPHVTTPHVPCQPELHQQECPERRKSRASGYFSPWQTGGSTCQGKSFQSKER